MKLSEIYALSGDVSEALQPFYAAAMGDVLIRHGLTGQMAFYLNVSLDFYPEPTSADRFQERWPYTSREVYVTGLAALVANGFAESLGDGTYRLTGKAQRAGQDIGHALADSLRSIAPLDAASLEEIAARLHTLVHASLTALEPAEKVVLMANRHSDPGADAPVLLAILQYIVDLDAFRDDAQLFTWRSSGVSAVAWEALTLLWRGEADSAHTIAMALPHRRHSATDYDRGLQEMVQRRWVEVKRGTPDGYTITDIGRTIREQAEQNTDRIFFAPWKALEPDQQASLGSWLLRLRDALQTVASA